jgi:ribonuclease HI
MKTLKFEHEVARLVEAGEKTSTWRINDDKNLSVNDEVRLIDKVDPDRPETWRVFGSARIDRVIEKRLSDITDEDKIGHETFATQEQMLNTYTRYFNNDVSLTTPVKMIHFEYSPLDTAKNELMTTSFISSVKIYADGGSRGNPGPSASGYVIIDPSTDKVLVDKGIYLGITTNNQAEYLALKYALEEAQKMGAREVDAYMDSLLVVNQLKGTFKVKNRDLWPLHEATRALIEKFDRFAVSHVPREMNKLADAAVNRAMDEEVGPKRPSPMS